MRCPFPDGLFRCSFTSGVFLLMSSVFVYIFIMVRIQTTMSHKPAVETNLEFVNRLINAPVERVLNFNVTTDKIWTRTHKRFLSFSIDSSAILRGLRKPSLRNLSLIKKMSHLRGGYLRVGGNAADMLYFSLGFRSPGDYQLPLDGGICSYDQTECEFSTNHYRNYAMSADNWNDINYFSKETGLKLLFDLNVLLRGEDGWNITNAELLLDFSFAYQYIIDWQLGNEPNSFKHRFKRYVSPSDLSNDFAKLRKLVQKYQLYNHSVIVGPDVTNPRLLNNDPTIFLNDFLSSKPDIDAVSWHHYYTGPNATLKDYLNVDILNSFIYSIDIIQDVVNNQTPDKQIWLTETGSSYNGGVHDLSDKFASSFLWIDKLGLAAKNNISVVVRQSIYRGTYSLLDEITLGPNPDYWVSILYKKLVGTNVLNVQCVDDDYDETLRVYAHCGKDKDAKKPVLFGLNVSNHSQGINLFFNCTAYLYSLTSPDLLSSKVLLNGYLMMMDYLDNLPPIDPIIINIDTKTPVPVLPYSIFFIVLDIEIPVC